MRKHRTDRLAGLISSLTEADDSDRRFRLLADAIPQMVWAAGLDGRNNYCNAQWVSYTGLTFEQSKGWGWTRAVHPDDLQRCFEAWSAAVEKGEAYEIEYRWKRASDGAYRWQLGRALPVKDANGNVVEWFGTVTDIEDQKQMQAVAERAARTGTEFLCGASDELRSPLKAIVDYAESMAAEFPEATPSQQARIEQLGAACRHLSKLIDEILDLAKVESGQVMVSSEPVLLDDALRECRAKIEPLAQRRGIRLGFPERDTSCFVRADPMRLKQILTNLLTHAVTYNHANGKVEVSCTTPAPGRVRVSIRDTGMGLTPEQLAQLFQPFKRLGQQSEPEEGAGIGLAAAKKLVELMSGVIGVDSQVGSGSTFWIELAAAQPPDITETGPVPPASSAARSPDEAAAAPFHTLLCVDDNPANQERVRQAISGRTDIRLLTAVTGQLGLARAFAAAPDVIVIDVHLPDVSGDEALKIFRNNPVTAHTPVIALSANATADDIQRGLKAGFVRYLTKPIDAGQLTEAVSFALEHRRNAAPKNA